MKIPNDKKLVDLYCYIDEGCLSLLDFLKKELPEGVGLEDVVLTQSYYPSDCYDPEGKDGHSEVSFGYLISKKSHDKKLLKKKIADEKAELLDMEKEVKLKKTRLAKLCKENKP